MKQIVSVVITDLDNTLYDWQRMWFASFSAMLTKLVEMSGIPRQQLEREFQEIHRRHGTSEYSFAIQELPSILAKHAGVPPEQLKEIYAPAIAAYRDARKANLELYPNVLETLNAIKDKGTMIVGYTESMAFYTNQRLKFFGLDRVLDYLFSPDDHSIPNGLSLTAVRRHPDEYYALRRTKQRHTPPGELKPNPKVLLDIIQSLKADPKECLYIGDSLLKDVWMAQQANVTDVHAAYGAAQGDTEAYQLLRRVSHWTDAMIAKEREMLAGKTVTPTFVLKNGIDELWGFFQFREFRPDDDDRKKNIIEMWKKAIDVQQHFNDLELRIRNFEITLIVAILSATAFALKEKATIPFAGRDVSLGMFFLAAGCVGTVAFYLMDRLWYHKLLYGAVKHASSIEQRNAESLPELALTKSIGAESPIIIPLSDGEVIKIRSPRKVDLFYALLLLTLLIPLACLYSSAPQLPPSSKPSRLIGQTNAQPLSPTH